MGIIVPDLLEQKLTSDKHLRSAVDGTVSDFSNWLNDSKLPFFTDYTDHGPEHVSQVLATSVAMMTGEARQDFTPADAAVLVVTTLLHDSAMHLSEVGFQELVQGEAKSWRIPEFDNRYWPELWEEFLFSAKRWDDRQLARVFGLTEDGKPRATVQNPFAHYTNLTDSDRKLIGEFIRCHHPRMAHEFAVFGVPGPSDDAIRVDGRLGKDLSDIAGLVARSHGLSARSCIDYLGQKYHRREFQGVHAVYLMTLLRVADYLQIRPGRANPIAFRYRHIPSKVSLEEWKAHNAIVNITQTHDDPESLEIQARPEDVHTFLRVKGWLAGIQAELDSSWAVLGEIYGSHPSLRRFGLILRRVRSNLDDSEAFERTVNYVPRRIEFDVARAQLLKLLIHPLYGDEPSIGIRELLQNSVDAVRELAFLQNRHPELRNVSRLDQAFDVEIWLDDPDEGGFAWLSVNDRGIGMTEEVVRDYFLTVGASFRYSEAWRKEFEAEDGELIVNNIHGPFRSNVLRSGKFGIGALAAFLLSNEIQVSTRHVSAKSGIIFKTNLNPEPIELRHDVSLRVGTTIRMRVSPEVQSRLKKEVSTTKIPALFDWYSLEEPSVGRLLGKDRTRLPRGCVVRLPEGERRSRWRKLSPVKDYDVYWSHAEAPALSCNGIYI